MLEQISGYVSEPTAAGISRAVARLAATGEIRPGARLPTVRALAAILGVSAATVGEAWQTLGRQGLIETQGRRGSFLRDASPREPVRHFRRVVGADLPLDVSTGYPDPELLPDLRPWLVAAAAGPPYTGYPDVGLLPDLAALLVPPILPLHPRPGGLCLSTDALVALGELLPLLCRVGDRVVVGEAEFAPYIDVLERCGLVPVPVPFDDDGPVAAAVERVLQDGAALAMLQSRVHNPTGLVTSPERLEILAGLCQANGTWVLEVDHSGRLASSPPITAAAWAPELTVHIRSFAKDLHPDLRVCVVTGPRELVGAVTRRRVGGAWVSRVNQDLLRLMLSSPEVAATVAASKDAYDQRRASFTAALADRGVHVRSRDGLNAWVPVRSEQGALILLAARGISASPGSAFLVGSRGTPHIRVSIACLGSELLHVAESVAQAATTHRMGGITSGA